MKKYALITLCCLALAYIGKGIVGIFQVAQHAEVPTWAIALDLTMLLGATLLPLILTVQKTEKKTWHYILWAPCILYVIGISINFLIRAPFRIEANFIGIIRLVIWLAIAFLFIRELPKKEKTA